MTRFSLALCLVIALTQLCGVFSRKGGYIPFKSSVPDVIKSPRPHEYLKPSDLPAKHDWRNVNGTNYCSKVLTQQSPSVCGSCWAEAATGAMSDRYAIATQNKLRIQIAPQQFLNFDQGITGGSCNGGDHKKALQFMHKYGVADDTCAAFVGVDAARGFEVNALTDVEAVHKHQCYQCDWDGTCGFASTDKFDLYHVDEYGTVNGIDEMKAEIYARGPIACHLYSEPVEFDQYWGGIIKCDSGSEDCKSKDTDHVIIIAGWGVDDATNTPYWVGRNSYGTQWGEGAGGGWFRLELGKDYLNMETGGCSWGVPAKADVERAVKQFNEASGI